MHVSVGTLTQCTWRRPTAHVRERATLRTYDSPNMLVSSSSAHLHLSMTFAKQPPKAAGSPRTNGRSICVSCFAIVPPVCLVPVLQAFLGIGSGNTPNQCFEWRIALRGGIGIWVVMVAAWSSGWILKRARKGPAVALLAATESAAL